MKIQLKFVVDRRLAEQFKQAVLERRGKLDLSREGEVALRMYLGQTPARPLAGGRDPLLDFVGMAASRGPRRPNALRDKKALYGGA